MKASVIWLEILLFDMFLIIISLCHHGLSHCNNIRWIKSYKSFMNISNVLICLSILAKWYSLIWAISSNKSVLWMFLTICLLIDAMTIELAIPKAVPVSPKIWSKFFLWWYSLISLTGRLFTMSWKLLDMISVWIRIDHDT